MSEPRRYTEPEVRRIFQEAAEGDAQEGAAPRGGDGLTLGELQEIGREVGLAPERIVAASLALDRTELAAQTFTALGMPVGTGQAVALPREPTDREWERLVAELRATFGAQGRTETVGRLRSWSNGNLRINVEPSADGTRLRMSTRRTGAREMTTIGGMNLLVAAVAGTVGLTGGDPALVGLAGVATATGVGLLGWNAIRLRGWVRRRREQMQGLASRALALTAGPPDS